MSSSSECKARACRCDDQSGPRFHAQLAPLCARARSWAGRSCIELDVASDTVKGDLTSLLGSSATVTMLPWTTRRSATSTASSHAPRMRGLRGGAHRYRLELRPWIWLLSRMPRPPHLPEPVGVGRHHHHVPRRGLHRVRGQAAEPAPATSSWSTACSTSETSLDFVTRLMEKYGLYYFFTHSDGQAHAGDGGRSELAHGPGRRRFRSISDETEYRRIDDHIWQWSSALHLQSGGVTLNDYNFTTPSADLTAKSLDAGSHSYGSYEMFDYPGPYGTTGDGQKLAAVRMQDIAARRQVLSGTSNCRGSACGRQVHSVRFHRRGAEPRIPGDPRDLYGGVR